MIDLIDFMNNLKFRYSEKTTKVWPIFHLQSKATKLHMSKKEWKIGQIFEAFSEFMNFKKAFCFKNCSYISLFD